MKKWLFAFLLMLSVNTPVQAQVAAPENTPPCKLTTTTSQAKDVAQMQVAATDVNACSDLCKKFAKTTVKPQLSQLPPGEKLTWRCFFQEQQLEEHILQKGSSLTVPN
ncbi:MAG: hypothetical protein EB060_04365 [Proteobacteria bacterium]|nr:hypothetical protein [Pseudomonadota bacterium]